MKKCEILRELPEWDTETRSKQVLSARTGHGVTADLPSVQLRVGRVRRSEVTCVQSLTEVSPCVAVGLESLPLSVSEERQLAILTELPFVVPFEERVKVRTVVPPSFQCEPTPARKARCGSVARWSCHRCFSHEIAVADGDVEERGLTKCLCVDLTDPFPLAVTSLKACHTVVFL